jgi:hypothetical protein
MLYIKIKTTHLFILDRGVEYKIVGQIGALGKDGFLEVWFGFGGSLGRGGRGGSDHLLEEPLTERPQVRGTEGGGHPGNLQKQKRAALFRMNPGSTGTVTPVQCFLKCFGTGSTLICRPGSGSGSRRAKMTQKNKKVKKFHVLKC